MKLQEFLTKVTRNDSSLATVRLSLTKRKNITKLLDALQDSKNLGCKNISELDLSGSHFTKEELASLVQALNNLPNITTLRLDRCEITDKNTHDLSLLKHVKTLSLKSNSLGSMALFSLEIIELYLDNNPNINAKMALNRFKSFPHNLQVLSLNQCNVDNHTLVYLMERGSKLRQLRELYLRANTLKYGCMDALRGFNLLTTLDIGDNFNITDLGDELHNECPKLEVLYADHCGLFPGAFKTIVKMAKLHTVDLSCNTRLLKDNSFQDLDLGDVTNFKNIRTMKLNGCRLLDQFIPELAQFFPEVVSLGMAQNRLTQSGVESLLKAFQQLRVLDVSTQELYKIPAPQKKTLSPRQEQALDARKAVLDSLLQLIRETPELTEINLDGTGLTSEMLLSLIPTKKDQRKLAVVNGLPCRRFEQQERAKLALKAAETSSSQEPEMVIEEISPRTSSRKTEIKRLNARVEQLEQELQKANATIAALKGETRTTELISGSVGDCVALFEAMGTQAKERRTQFEGLRTHGQFRPQRAPKKQGAERQLEPVASSSSQQDEPRV